MPLTFPRFVALIAALMLSGPAFAQSSEEAPPPADTSQQSAWAGDWTGWGDQGSSQWSIDITFDRTETAQIDYASIPCAGVLRLMEQSAQVRVYRETLTSNAQNCIDNGIVTLTLTDDMTMSFAWTDGQGGSADGTLRSAKPQ